MTNHRLAKIQWGIWVGIVGNLGLAVFKGVAGLGSGSRALLADAAHSAADAVCSLAVWLEKKDAHAHSHKEWTLNRGKAETVSAILVSVLMMISGAEIAIHSAKAMATGITSPPQGFALTVIIVAIALKEATYQYKYRFGKLAPNRYRLLAMEHRADVYASLAALVGISGALLGQWLDAPWMYILDPAAGVFISLLIFRSGYRLVTESIQQTLDHVLRSEDSGELREAAANTPGVIRVDELHACEHGGFIIVDVKISVNPRITVSEANDIAKLVKHHLMSRFHRISDVFVHINPYDTGYPYKTPFDTWHDDQPTILH
ncbi:MAG TPA: cation diffusion facilitator family transporter [Bacilli bacterium]